MEKTYSLRQAFGIVSQYEGWKNIVKFRTAIEYNQKYKADITGNHGAKRFVIPQETINQFISDIKSRKI